MIPVFAAAKNGLDDGPVLSVMEAIATSGITTGYSQRIAAGDYDASSGFAVDLALKDVGHVRTLGTEVGCPVPVADLAHNHLVTAKAKWGGEMDWGAIALSVRDAAGLPSNDKKATQ